MNAIFHLSEEGKRRRLRQASLLMASGFVVGAVIVGIVGRERFFPENGEADIAVPIFFLLMIGLLVFIVRRRAPAIVESHMLLLDDSGLTLMQNGKPVIAIAHDRVECLEIDADGSIFVIGPRGKNALQITRDYADVDRLREELELLHDVRPRRRGAFPMRYQRALGFLLLVPVSVLILSDSPMMVIPSSAILLGVNAWCLIGWWRAYGLKGTGARLIGSMILFAGMIIVRTLVVLGLLWR